MVVYIMPAYLDIILWQIFKLALSLTSTDVCVAFGIHFMGACVFRVVHRHYLRIAILD